MLTEIDFFGSSNPRSGDERRRKIESFVADPAKRPDFLAYGYHYWDSGEYGVGYGSYRYDGRYAGCAERMIAHYRLPAGARVLEIGCAKGFVLVEFLKQGMAVSGIDLSAYAVEHAAPEVKPFLVQGSCEHLPWSDGEFDFVYSKETLPHLSEAQLRRAIPEAQRVCRTGNIFFEIQVVTQPQDRELMRVWDETHQSLESADWWRRLLGELDFRGQVNFKPLF